MKHLLLTTIAAVLLVGCATQAQQLSPAAAVKLDEPIAEVSAQSSEPLAHAKSLIDLKDAAQVRERRPLLIAHRGGVITERSPECSLAAIELAAESCYSMVELDVQSSLDGVPIVFHDRSLLTACGRLGRTSDYSASELLTFVYTGTSQKILSLEIALRKCRALGLGVMLDLKHGREDAPFLDRVDQLITRCQLTTATVSISGSVEAREQLKHIMFTPTNGQMSRFNRGENVDLEGTFWFGLPRDLSGTDVARLKACGAYVFPAINTFRYPKEGHRELAQKDIKRLVSDGVHGFQIDSIYSDLVTRSKKQVP
jgi:hypothetical protein